MITFLFSTKTLKFSHEMTYLGPTAIFMILSYRVMVLCYEGEFNSNKSLILLIKATVLNEHVERYG